MLNTQRICIALVVASVLFCSPAYGLECRAYSGNCDSCLQDPNCGYCGVSGACVAGSTKGPYVGNCSQWEFDNCGSNPPNPTTAAPSSLSNVWGTFGGDNGRTGYAPLATKNLTMVGVASGIQCLTAPVSSEKYALCVASPCNVIAVDHSTKEMAWNASITSAGYSSLSPPFYDPVSRKVVVQINLPDEGTLITALEVDTGLLNWTYNDNSQWPNLPYGLVAHDGLVYAPVGEQTSFVVALRLSDGLQVWRQEGYTADAGCDTWAPTVAMIENKAQVLWNKETGESYPTMIGSMDAATGAALWTISFKEDWDGYSAYWYPVAAADGTILGAPWEGGRTTFTALKINGSSVDIAWQMNVSGQNGGLIAVANDVAYLQFKGQQRVVAVDLHTGAVVQVLDATPLSDKAPIIVTKTSLISINANGNCAVLIDLASGALVNQYCVSTADNLILGLAVAAGDGTLIVTGSQDVTFLSLL